MQFRIADIKPIRPAHQHHFAVSNGISKVGITKKSIFFFLCIWLLLTSVSYTSNGQTITLSAPLKNDTYFDNCPVTYSISETPKTNTTQLIFTLTGGPYYNQYPNATWTLTILGNAFGKSFSFAPLDVYNANNPFTATTSLAAGTEMVEGTYSVQASYKRFSTGTTVNSILVTNITLDLLTVPPIILMPVNKSTVTNHFTLKDTLPNTLQSGSKKIIFAGPSNATLQMSNSQAESFSVNTQNLASSSANITGVTGATSLADGDYTITLSYQDIHGHAAATAIDTITLRTQTLTPTITAPATASNNTRNLNVNITIPESYLAGTVKMLFNKSGVIDTLVMANNLVVGGNTFTLDTKHFSSSAYISSAKVDTLSSGNYTVSLLYQDALGNPIASTSVTNVTINNDPLLAPTTPATNILFTNTSLTTTTASWTNGNGTSRAVFMLAGTTGSPAPVDLTAYNANAAFGSGDQIGTTGWYCVYNGTGTTVNITGLTQGTTYRVMTVEYNGTTPNVAYLTTTGTGAPANLTTLLPGPSITATGTLTAFSACAGTASSSQNFTVSGIMLGTNALTVTPPTGFELSLIAGGTYSNNTISLTPVSGTVATTTIYARMASGSTSPVAGNITIASSGATSQTVAVSGTVNAVPTITIGTINSVYTNSTSFSIPFSATTGTPTQYSIATGTRALAGFTTITTATLGASPISVNIPASAAGTYDFNLTVNTATCTSVTMPFTLTIAAPTPTIATTGTLSALSTSYGTASSTGTFSVSGSFMTAGILVTAPTGFEVSLSSGSGFGSSVTVGASGTIASTPVYIRLVATDAVSTYSGNVVLTSPGATSANVATVSSTVNKAPLTITANGINKPYGTAISGGLGSTAFTITAGSLQNSETISSVSIAYGAGSAATDPVNTYTGSITPSAAVGANGFSTSNYNITYATGNIVVNAVSLTITATGPSKIYGTALVAGTSGINFTTTATANGETVNSVTLTPDAAGLSATTTAGSAYVITPSSATGTGGFLPSNYIITFIPYNGTVAKAPLTITANNQSKVYGAVLPTLTSSYNGFVNGDTNTSLTTQPTLATTATAASAVNTYPITVSGAVSSNYSISYTAGTLAVTQAPLTITATNATKVYGSVNPTLAVTYAGFVGSDNASSLTTQPTISTTALTSSGVGSYPITASGAASLNYSISYSPAAILTITPAPLTIIANNQTRVINTANPILTVSYSGFVNGDTNASLTTQPTLTTTAVTGSLVGTYPITAAGAASPNYNISYVAGVLTVTASTNANLANLIISAGALSPIYAQGTTAYTISVANAVSSATITPTLADATASIKVNGVTVASGSASATIPLLVGANIITTIVTAQDGVTKITYTITVTRAPSSNAGLANLTISNGTLSPVFASGTFSYTDLVDYSVGSITVTPSLADATATILVNGLPAANNSATSPINLIVGDNAVSVVITAQDGITIQTYTIIVHRAAPPQAIYANNIISPNGDGKNDVWVVKDILSYPNNTVTVFDRAGRIVYSKHTYSNDWNGTFQGSPLAEGTYYYVIDLGTGKDPVIKGFITIFRNR